METECGCINAELIICEPNVLLLAPNNLGATLAGSLRDKFNNTRPIVLTVNGLGEFTIDSTLFPEGAFNTTGTWILTATDAGVPVIFVDPLSLKENKCVEINFIKQIV